MGQTGGASEMEWRACEGTSRDLNGGARNNLPVDCEDSFDKRFQAEGVAREDVNKRVVGGRVIAIHRRQHLQKPGL